MQKEANIKRIHRGADVKLDEQVWRGTAGQKLVQHPSSQASKEVGHDHTGFVRMPTFWPKAVLLWKS